MDEKLNRFKWACEYLYGGYPSPGVVEMASISAEELRNDRDYARMDYLLALLRMGAHDMDFGFNKDGKLVRTMAKRAKDMFMGNMDVWREFNKKRGDEIARAAARLPQE